MCRKDVGDFYTLNICEQESLPTPLPPSAPIIVRQPVSQSRSQVNYRTIETRQVPPQQLQNQQARIKLARVVCLLISSFITICIIVVMVKILQHSNT
jgi:hypothetical protein